MVLIKFKFQLNMYKGGGNMPKLKGKKELIDLAARFTSSLASAYR